MSLGWVSERTSPSAHKLFALGSVQCVFDSHFDFRLTATYSHPLLLPMIKTQHRKSLLGDAMLPPHSVWVAMSQGD